MHICYMDDSGEDDVRAFSILTVPVDQWKTCFNGIKEYRRRLRASDGIFMKKELHATKFLSGHGYWSDRHLSLERRVAIYRDSLSSIARLPGVRLFNGIGNRRYEERILERLLNRLNRACQEWGSYAVCVSDEGKDYAKLTRRMGVFNPIPSMLGGWREGLTKNIPLDRLIDVSSAAQDPTQILADVVDAPWIPLAQRASIYQRILQSKQDALGKLAGIERDNAEQYLGSWQVRWIAYLIRTKQYAQAADAIAALSKETREAQAAALVPLDLRVTAQLGTLDSKIAGYRAEPQSTPASNLLRNAARQLFEAGDKQSARKILEFVFAHEIDEHQLNAANFLGLAEIRLVSEDTPGALDLLRRLVVAVGNPFENLDPAAALLEKTGHHAEAIEFLDQLVKSAPWDPSYRLRLAKARLAAAQDAPASQDALGSVASGASVPYDLRIKAAAALSGRAHADLGSGELNLLAGNAAAISPAAADKFYFYEARIKATQNATDSQTKLQLLSHCVIDFPRRDEARVPLFQVAASMHSDEFAIGVLAPLLHTQFMGSTARSTPDSEDEQIISSDIGSGDEEGTESDDSSSHRG